MDLINDLKNISESIPKQIDHIETEEATKTALIMPFINALGYNLFDPTEVVPEFTCDVGTKKGEKVDYAIIKDGKPALLIECKHCDSDLDKEHASQLFRYFAANTPARFAILTNGINYRFFTDIDKPNIMDNKPFLEIDMCEIKESDVKELEKFTKDEFDPSEIFKVASELKYVNEMKKIIQKEINDPSEDFVKFLAKKVYKKPITEKVRLKFTGITKTAMNQIIKDQVNDRLKSALEVSNNPDNSDTEAKDELKTIDDDTKKIITTEDEWEGYYIVKAILHEIIDADRVLIKDTLSYCAVNLDNTKKPICRLRFNTKQKYIGLFDENKKEEKIPIENIKDIYNYAKRLKDTIDFYDKL
ncbi:MULTISPECIES: type I restriction endonuclease [Methanobacterium]|uniref:Restriction endonuclease n=1 Tax=Methanobacterium bryantii TaxID=2161 RepID=A0A2A2H986_METBR|nr:MULTISPECIES: type I restriction endonuclease [Methanobacterium]OEC85679.1 restriction endonuclease [Methanobacterium sp. A39]PAV05886.1 restriction endonuclease [Methanobacterium bryantii]